ncbi:RNA-binding protein [Opitutaceae bacterium TAV4]|uniref:NYN domain-containing protein n=1 Tax=Geminisphaera colitermitum TaxID=1148786 RepID=UPI000158DC1B|nr:NYN domain-containing protein [Geminisphaera colitermitum]RRJ95425.1 RNA-binding protein [Opitutaceae bacterium TAV4]RRJ99608.1 RNA-binding protein [Opitutaceae bacterium TAV3]
MSGLTHLIIDGSNILHAWPELRALLKRDRDAARARLIDRLAPIHDLEAIRLTLVFDGRGPELVVEHPVGPASFSIIYTPAGTTADDVIEQLVARSATPATCLVATDDQAERSTIEAAGAAWCSARELEARSATASQRQTANTARLNRQTAKTWRTPPPC